MKSCEIMLAFAAAGKKLVGLRVNFESAKEFPMKRHKNKAVKLDWRVEVMKVIGRRRSDESPTKKDQSLTSSPTLDLYHNDFLTLSGIPAGVHNYRLGNRGALERVIDPFHVTHDDQGRIVGDPNRLDDVEYPVRLPGQVITVRLETLEVVKALPAL